MSRVSLTRIVVAATVVAATVVVATPLHAQARAVSNARPTTVDTLQRIYQRFLDGLRLRDTTMYRDLLAPNYVHVYGDSARATFGRANRLAWDAARTNTTISEFRVLRCDLQMYPGTAVGPCWYRNVGTDEGAAYDGVGVALVTFVRGAGNKWQIAATRPSTSAGLPPAPERQVVRTP
jgi:hypothetical protein